MNSPAQLRDQLELLNLSVLALKREAKGLRNIIDLSTQELYDLDRYERLIDDLNRLIQKELKSGTER